jgi:DNA-nicking Smr family endonuclease
MTLVEPGKPEPSGDAIVVPIEDGLDLHGFRPRDVLDVVDAYLDAAGERGLLEVRLIHGRGKGVQRAQIRGMLAVDPRVVRFEEAPPGRGGWGATLVWLRETDAPAIPLDPQPGPSAPPRGSPPETGLP